MNQDLSSACSLKHTRDRKQLMLIRKCMQHFCQQPGAARTSLSDTILRHGGRGGVVSGGAQRAARLRQRAAVHGLARAQAFDLALRVAQCCLNLRAWAQA